MRLPLVAAEYVAHLSLRHFPDFSIHKNNRYVLRTAVDIPLTVKGAEKHAAPNTVKHAVMIIFFIYVPF